MNRESTAVVLLLTTLAASSPALAYVGPGAGLSLLGALWGLLIAIGSALVFVIVWPLRRLRQRRQADSPPALPRSRGR